MSTLIHVLRPKGHYIGQVREYGFQKYRTVTGRCRTAESAIARTGAKMKGQHRLRVLFVDHSPYYEPNLVFEGIRR